MMSVSKAWAYISREIHGQKFLDELAHFLKNQGVKKILECGCGDGHVLYGLAQRGLEGVGIDSDPEMIALALEDHQHFHVSYHQMNWLDLAKLGEDFEGVICRGNSLPNVFGCDRKYLQHESSRIKIDESINLFFQKLKKEGVLYVDTSSQKDIYERSRCIEIKTPSIKLTGRVECDLQRMERRVFGSGKILGEDFSGGSVSYLLTPNELEKIIGDHYPSVIWSPRLDFEKNYGIICAKK